MAAKSKSGTMAFKAKSETKQQNFNSVSDVKIRGEGRDEWGNRYFKFSVRKSKIDVPPILSTDLIRDPNKIFALLSNAGWNPFTTKTRTELLAKIEGRKAREPSFRVATRVGWNGSVFVLPGETFGKGAEPLETAFAGLDPAMLGKYRTRGSLKEWQDQIASLCGGNSRLIFAMALALTGPVLKFVKGPRGGGFQLYGDAEAGKTTAAMVAGSVWGCHRDEVRREKGFAENWNSTAGKIEVTVLAHNDIFFILDETNRAGQTDRERAKIVMSVGFGLAEHTEKERLTNVGGARSWRCYFLSTSNQSFREIAIRGGIAIDEAYFGRLVDIPMPRDGHGVFEDLHDYSNGGELSDVLQRRCKKHYGVAGRAFITKIVEACSSDRAGLSKWLAKERRAYRKLFRKKSKAQGLTALNRATDRFATVFAAASLAITHDILPWRRKEALRAILSCQMDQLRHPAPISEIVSEPVQEARHRLIHYLKANHNNMPLLNKKRPLYGIDGLDDVPGYRFKNEKSRRWYYLTPKQWDRALGERAASQALKRQLASEGYLRRGRKTGFVVQTKIFSGGKKNQNFARVYVIKAKLTKGARQ
jgi:uncharacterized protein (DUF927 family)